MVQRIMIIAEADVGALNQLIFDDSVLDVTNPLPDAFARPVYAPSSTTITGRIVGWELSGGDFGTIVGIANAGGMDLTHYNTQSYPQNVLDAGFRFDENTAQEQLCRSTYSDLIETVMERLCWVSQRRPPSASRSRSSTSGSC